MEQSEGFNGDPNPDHKKTSNRATISQTTDIYRHLIQIEEEIFIKVSIFLKIGNFIIRGRFNKLLYGINTIVKYGTGQPVKFHLVSRSWNELNLFIVYLN